MRRIWLIVVLLGTFGCQRVENVIERREPPPVRAVQVRSGRLPQVLTFTGTLQARKRAAVNSTVAGIVERVAVRDGDTVRAGQPVIWLQSAELAAQLREQEAAVQVARTRVSQLEAQVALSASQVRGSVEQAQATYKQAQISVVAARTQLQQAQSDVRRYTTLYQQKAIPHSQLEQAQLKVKLQQDQLETALSQQTAAREAVTSARQGSHQVMATSAELWMVELVAFRLA